jgi:hypothetical protein
MKSAGLEKLGAELDSIERESTRVVAPLVNALAVREELDLITRSRDFQVMSGAARYQLEAIDNAARVHAYEWVGLLVNTGEFLGKLQADAIGDLRAAQARIAGASWEERAALARLFPDAATRSITADDVADLRRRVADERAKLKDGRLLAAHPFGKTIANANQLTIRDTRKVFDTVHAMVIDLISVLMREHRICLEMGLSYESLRTVRPVVEALLFGPGAADGLRKVKRRDFIAGLHRLFDEGRLKPHFNSAGFMP